MNLHPQLMQAIEESGFTSPTPIQSEMIPVMLTGHDVIGQAQTGTGKTAAFALPVLHNLIQRGGRERTLPQALVLAPTRELAQQVARAFYELGHHKGVQVLAIYGGTPYGRQVSRLRKGVDVVVGTPGRLLDLLSQGALNLSALNTLILDEADEMLSMGFIEDIEKILAQIPEDRQMALFSATMPNQIRRLADKYMRDPISITIARKQLTAATVSQRYYVVNQRDKLAAVTRLFEVEPITSALIFTKTRAGSNELAHEMSIRGFSAEALNGDLSQQAREHVLARFRKKAIKVLVATDVAARGLDIDDISHVFNFDMPHDEEGYVHRIGRTGRAGREGVAISLVTPREQGRMRRIEYYTKQKATKAILPTIEEIQAFREHQLQTKMEVWLNRGRAKRERVMAEQLAAMGFDPLDIAAAALKLARFEEKQRPIPAIGRVREDNYGRGNYGDRRGRGGRGSRDPRGDGRRREGGGGRRNGFERGDRRRSSSPVSHEQGMVRIVLNSGRSHGVRPGDIVRSLASGANIPGSKIGAIHIERQHTYVDIPESVVGKVLAHSGEYRMNRNLMTATISK
ncbi:MAG TPA: DEAD/DEAH box helicase [Anaerolineae bacterium]|nr:DEAD/DEAH box helicase [Anaerolineae bacterium]